MLLSSLRLTVLCAVAAGLSNSLAGADVTVRSVGLELETGLSAGTRSGELDQARLRVRPELALRAGRHWSLETGLRLEAGGDDTGLGTIETFDELSKPLELGPDGRIELEEMVLAWRQRATRLSVGKQTFAWGVLDGLQVTDRLDAIRLNEAAFTENRPQRIGRWGLRAQFEARGLRLDLAALSDATANQLAQPDEVFAVRAPRSRGGLPMSVVPDRIGVELSDTPTAGLRVSRTIGTSDISLVAFNGPETDPVFRPDGDDGVTLAYPTRSLLGATWQTSAGSRVWRLELAHVPDQPVNLAPSPGLRTDRAARWLGGAGVDWDLPGTSFLNAQIGIDHLAADDADLVRPGTDVIATIRLNRSFANDTLRARAELIGSLSDGDGVFRPALTWQAGDRLAWDLGADLVWGSETGLIGQFEDASRIFLRTRLSL